MNQVKVLFVCMGNICRSPTAHGVFRKLVQQAGLEAKIQIDSAGTHAYHTGEPPDPRSQAAAKDRGIDISDLRSRVVEIEDFRNYDYILVMDHNNYNHLMNLSPPELQNKIQLFLEYAPELKSQAVPDPYYSGLDGFELALDMIEKASYGLLKHLCGKYNYVPSKL